MWNVASHAFLVFLPAVEEQVMLVLVMRLFESSQRPHQLLADLEATM
jgi:hypothetical protein